MPTKHERAVALLLESRLEYPALRKDLVLSANLVCGRRHRAQAIACVFKRSVGDKIADVKAISCVVNLIVKDRQAALFLSGKF